MGSVAQVEQDRVSVGVDTHKDTHTATVKDSRGATLSQTQVPASAAGYRALVAWATSFGEVEAFGIEGTGCYGAGLSRHLLKEGFTVREVTRGDRKARRHKGKSDPVDSESAARSVQAGEATATPKNHEGPVEQIRMLKLVRSTAMKNRTQAINQMHAVVVTAPDELRQELAGMGPAQLVRHCCEFEDGTGSVIATARFTLASLARLVACFESEIARIDARLGALVAAVAPALLACHGVGVQTAAQLLATFGDNPERITSEAAFARLCGVAPLEASSGKVRRHRLSRSGDRQANAALYTIVVVRMRSHEPTRAYVERRLKEGKTKREIMRCLKRYVAREVYTVVCPKSTEPVTVAA